MDIYILTAIIVFTLLAFVREWLPIDAVALTCLGMLLAFDLISPTEAIAGFSNPAVITVMMMFVLSESLTRTGLIAKLGHRIASLSGRSFWTRRRRPCSLPAAFFRPSSATPQPWPS